MSEETHRKGRFRITWVRRLVQVLALALFAAPPLVAGWSLFGLGRGSDDAIATPAELPFFGSLSSSSIAGVNVLDPFAMLQVAAASKTFALDWLTGMLPVLVVYGLVRGRAFCGWVCPVNLLTEGVGALRRKAGIRVAEAPVGRHAKIFAAVGVLAVSALLSIPLFEAVSPIGAIGKGLLFGSTAGLVFLLAIVVSELFWGDRVWCRSLCPLGGFYEVLGTVGQVNVKMNLDDCIHCDACKNACLADPSILDPVLEGKDTLVRVGDCMACGACIDVCPTSALSFCLGRLPFARKTGTVQAKPK